MQPPGLSAEYLVSDIRKCEYIQKMNAKISHDELLKQWIAHRSVSDGDRYTQKRLSIETGISEQSISRIISGGTKNPDMRSLDKIAAAFEVSVSEYLEGPPNSPRQSIPVYDDQGQHIEDLDMRPIPVLTSIRCADGVYFEDSYPPGHVAEYIPRSGVKGEHVFAVKVIGDSMEPDLIEGDYLTVDPDKPFIKYKGGIAVICMPDGRTIIRRVYRHNGTMTMVPSNPAYSPEIAQSDAVRIFKVVKVMMGYNRLNQLF